eukprot:scaffold395_cov243-Pinguiococcus_pyrenoidosus.AAC.35
MVPHIVVPAIPVAVLVVLASIEALRPPSLQLLAAPDGLLDHAGLGDLGRLRSRRSMAPPHIPGGSMRHWIRLQRHVVPHVSADASQGRVRARHGRPRAARPQLRGATCILLRRRTAVLPRSWPEMLGTAEAPIRATILGVVVHLPPERRGPFGRGWRVPRGRRQRSRISNGEAAVHVPRSWHGTASGGARRNPGDAVGSSNGHLLRRVGWTLLLRPGRRTGRESSRGHAGAARPGCMTGACGTGRTGHRRRSVCLGAPTSASRGHQRDKGVLSSVLLLQRRRVQRHWAPADATGAEDLQSASTDSGLRMPLRQESGEAAWSAARKARNRRRRASVGPRTGERFDVCMLLCCAQFKSRGRSSGDRFGFSAPPGDPRHLFGLGSRSADSCAKREARRVLKDMGARGL